MKLRKLSWFYCTFFFNRFIRTFIKAKRLKSCLSQECSKYVDQHHSWVLKGWTFKFYSISARKSFQKYFWHAKRSFKRLNCACFDMYTYLIIICIRIYILNFTTRRGKTPGGNVQRDFSKKVCKFFEFVAKLFGFESFFQDGPVFGRIFWWLSSSEPYENKSRTQTGPRFEMVNSKDWSFGRLLIGQYTELHCRSWSSSSLTF